LILVHEDFLLERAKICPCEIFMKNDPVKGTIRTEFFAEGYMGIEKKRGIIGLLRGKRI